uniref:CCHC-type domain-containing protein n=1 Tax=Nelumbo nucifera TaxID=4432 RepID=A0A822YKD6_NELNU|nr:TPA_asm: hypothetical protein HUJ06_010286 [Nelumbo nucifera]
MAEPQSHAETQRTEASMTLMDRHIAELGVEVDYDDSGGWVYIFDSEEDMQRVLNGSPWFIRSSWMLLAKWREGSAGERIKLWHQNLWVQLINVPRSHIPEKNCKFLASAVGRVLNSPNSTSPGKPSWGRAICMRVEIDLGRPLFRGFFLKNSVNPTWIRFVYEGMTKVCFYCGLVGHRWKKCRQLPPGVPHDEIIIEMENRSLEAPGEWLRADYKPEKPLKIPAHQIAPTACRQTQLIRRDASSDEDSEDELAEKRPRLLEVPEQTMNRQRSPYSLVKEHEPVEGGESSKQKHSESTQNSTRKKKRGS